MTTKTKTAQFTRGEERVHVQAADGAFGDWPAAGVIEEVAEDWVGFRYHNDDEVHVFGEHPHSRGSLDDLRPVTR